MGMLWKRWEEGRMLVGKAMEDKVFGDTKVDTLEGA